MKLGLGTVQFGLDYGITNTTGKTPVTDVRAILAECLDQGVDTLDTAALYGEAEAVIGANLPRPHNFRIVGKTLHLDHERPLAEALETVRTGVIRSLSRLGEQKLAALLVHRVDDLLGPAGEALFRTLVSLREAGLVEKIGASVYTPAEVAVLTERFPLEIIQLPLNILDQRMLESGTLTNLRQCHIEIHVRSAFLQGVLLTDNPQQIPLSLTRLAPTLNALTEHLRAHGLSPLDATLGFLKSLNVVDVVICGASQLSEWREISKAFGELPDLPADLFKYFAQSDVNFIDPRRWRR